MEDSVKESGEIYFATCKHRSLEKQPPVNVVQCCGARPAEASYFCWKLSKDNLEPADCAECIYYKEKKDLYGG